VNLNVLLNIFVHFTGYERVNVSGSYQVIFGYYLIERFYLYLELLETKSENEENGIQFFPGYFSLIKWKAGLAISHQGLSLPSVPLLNPFELTVIRFSTSFQRHHFNIFHTGDHWLT